MSGHLKRLFSPKTWKISKKGLKYVAKPSPGAHEISMCLPLSVIMKGLLCIAKNTKEVKYILQNKTIMVDGIRRKDHRFPVGLFDVLSFADTNEHYRIVLDDLGKLCLVVVTKGETGIKVCKIIGKRMIGKKLQLNLYDGKNILVEKDDYKVGDSVLISFGKKLEIKEKIKLDKGATVYLTGGKHVGGMGKIQNIIGNRLLYKNEDGDIIETLKEYAFPIGNDKPLITTYGAGVR